MASAAKVDAAFRAVQAAYDTFGEKLEALEAVINDEKTSGQVARDLVKSFAVMWQARYGQPYVVAPSWPGAIKAVKDILRELDAEELQRRITRYLGDDDRYYVQASHPLALFIKCINKFAGGTRDDATFLTVPPVDCKHRPVCKSEQQHTQRRGTEARA